MSPVALKLRGKSPKQIIMKVGELKPRRANFESTWQAVGDYLIPRKNDIQKTSSPGEPKYVQLLDPAGATYAELLAGTLHSMLTNPAGFFFGLTSGDRALDQIDSVRLWMQKVVQIMHDVLNNSNFQTEIHEFYLDIVNFGTASMSIEEDAEDTVRFACRPIQEIFIEENSVGVVDTLYRCYKMTCRALVDEFGYENLPEKIQKQYDDGKDERHEVIHCIYPSKHVYEDKKAPFDFLSQYILVDQKQTLRVKGYKEFPYIVARWTKVSGEEYGRGPGEKALPAVKMQQKIMETTIKGAQKTVDPPLQAPDDGFVLPLVTRPGGFNYYRAGSEDRIQPIFADARVDFGFQMIEIVDRKIRDAFYVDQLKLRDGPQMTATEVTERSEQSLRFLGPMFGRLQKEKLQPTVERVYKICDRKGLFPPPPPELNNVPLQVQYTSVMAMAQRQSQVQNIQRTMQAITPFASADPRMLRIFNGEFMGKHIAQLFNFPQEGIRSKEELEEMDKQEQAQQQAMMQNAQAQQTADTAAKMIQAAGKVSQPA